MSGTTLKPQLDSAELVGLLRRRVAGEPFPESHSFFIHEADAHSAGPADLVRGRVHAPGSDRGDGKGGHWYFCCPAKYRETAAGRPTTRRKRTVAVGEGCWHLESKKQPIQDRDKKSVGAFATSFSYRLKLKNPPGTEPRFTNKGTGWCMTEIELEEKHDAGSQLVLSKVYRSPRADRGTSSAAAGDAPPPIDQMPPCSARVADGVSPAAGGSSGMYEAGDGQRGRADAANMPSPSIGPAASEAEFGMGWVLWCRTGAAPVAADTVMKFGRSSIASAQWMMEAAKLVLGFPEETLPPMVVLSAMEKTTTNLHLAAEKAVRWRTQNTWKIHELEAIEELHLRTVHQLGIDSSIVSGPLDELKQLLKYVAFAHELTPKTRDLIVSYGERMSTEIFSAYLNKYGKGEQQKWVSKSITTVGSGGSDLTAITIGRELRSREILVWKDVNGLFTCDPIICPRAVPLPFLTFDEAAELGFFAAQSMQLAMGSDITVIVKSLYNSQAAGTILAETRHMSESELTRIMLTSNLTMLDIKSTGMFGQSGFVANAFSIFQNFGISVDCVAISEGKILMILVPSKLLSHELIQLKLGNVIQELEQIAAVHQLPYRSVISLIGNAEMSVFILEKVFRVLRSINVKTQMSSYGSSKMMKISLVVHDIEAKRCVEALHSEFFEGGSLPEVPGAADWEHNGSLDPAYSTAAASSGHKRKWNDEHPEAPQGVRQGRTETELRLLMGSNDPETELLRGCLDLAPSSPAKIESWINILPACGNGESREQREATSLKFTRDLFSSCWFD